MTKEEIDRMQKKVDVILNEEFLNSKSYVQNKRDWLSAYWQGFKSPEQLSVIQNTGSAHLLLGYSCSVFNPRIIC